ncbi:dihydroxyacetone kinase subunit DhaK [Microbacterium halophytorum]|uniref:dihydroxyacetone kinase subunit DhaK n=1 Tax=Microbacterium halophytorum TaxID=2067568 RepID=UPI000CFB6F96|nr:dihydroxyacetone kinase subunit DhaK [Microbacterium halophytorum]
MSTTATTPTSPLFLPEDDLVLTALRGHCATTPGLELHEEPLFVTAADPASGRRVALVSGGGAGHEPLHVGFVGRGGLDAAVPGRVFASPHNRQVFEASRAAAKPGGVLHIVKNYTGDVINFAIAAERLEQEGIPARRVIVDDDIATDGSGVGRRGTGATFVVEKLLGALADTGADLDALEALGNRAAAESRSLAAATRPLTSVASGLPAFDLAPGEMALGIGIHGEAAPDVVPIRPAEQLVPDMVARILAALPDRPGRAIVVVNGLGATTPLELDALAALTGDALEAAGIMIDSMAVGTFVSSLDMHGFSVTITRSDDERLALWLTETGTSGFPALTPYRRPARPDAAASDHAPDAASADPLLARLSASVDDAFDTLTALDQRAGDGDFGDNLRNACRTAERLAAEPGGSAERAGLAALSTAFLDHVGGSSGPLIGLLVSSIDAAVARGGDPAATLLAGIRNGEERIRRVGGAFPGDRTLVDPLHAAAESGATTVDALVAAAADGARATRDMSARRGRASYVAADHLDHPDAGAVGVVILLAAIAESLAPDEAVQLRATAAELLADCAA